MKRPLTNLITKQAFPEAFLSILDFHLDDNSIIFDPTYGEGHSWKAYDNRIIRETLLDSQHYQVITYSENLYHLSSKLEVDGNIVKPDAIFFDPPYIFGLKQSKDKRQVDYGEYDHGLDGLKLLVKKVNSLFPDILKKEGKLFFKYCDIFSMEDRQYYFCPQIWLPLLSNFKVIDHYIIAHHHVNPTAWQVKDRPCGVVNYTYLTVLSLI